MLKRDVSGLACLLPPQVLTNPSSHTTILGPASRIQLLEDDMDRQVRGCWLLEGVVACIMRRGR